jgi:hypothetical protein
MKRNKRPMTTYEWVLLSLLLLTAGSAFGAAVGPFGVLAAAVVTVGVIAMWRLFVPQKSDKVAP